jgi:DNA-binding CsgD family transcriptional regulator
LDGARELVREDLARLGDHRYVLAQVTVTAVELAAAEHRVPEIIELVETALDRVLPVHGRLAAQFVGSALGALADDIPPSTPARTVAAQHGEAWLARVEAVCFETMPDAAMPDVGSRLALARVELARLRGDQRAHTWTEVVDAWRRLDAAYELACAQLRLAEATLNETGPQGPGRAVVRTLLQSARSAATSMRAAPLVEQIDTLARRARLGLDDDALPEARPSDDPYGLTGRELEVLRLVAEGCSNGQIGGALFISRKTASVHVSNILRKLGVTNRIEAAAIAMRAGAIPDG